MGVPPNGRFIEKIPLNIHDLGAPSFQETIGVPKMGVPQKLLVYFMEEPVNKGMRTGGTPISGNLPISMIERGLMRTKNMSDIYWLLLGTEPGLTIVTR